MLPEDWHRSTVGENADTLTGFAFPSQDYVDCGDAAVRLLRGDNVMQGVLRWEEAKFWPIPYDSQFCRYEMKSGDLVIAMDRPITKAGLKCSSVEVEDLPCLLVQRVARIRTKEMLDQGYLAQVLQGAAFQQHLKGQKTESAVPHISPNDIRDFSFAMPEIDEQRRIARILSTWDQAIATAERLVAASQTEKDVLANALLSGRRRLIQHQRWEPRPLSSMVSESRVLGSGGDTAKKLTVKLYGRGVVGKTEKRVGSESTQYYRRSAGQFIYSKLDFLNGAFGLVPANLDGYESTLDLPAFDFLPGTEPRWFLHFVSRQQFYLGHLGLANGGRKARRVGPSDLLRVSIDTPSFAEQRAIAEAIDLARARVSGIEHQVRLLRNEKAALTAQLLTGRRRVHLDQPGTVSP